MTTELVKFINSFGEELMVEPSALPALQAAKDAALASKGKGKGKGKASAQGKAKPQADTKPNGNGNGRTTMEQAFGTTDAQSIAVAMKERAKEEAKAEKEAEANKLANEAVANFHDVDLETEIAKLVAEADSLMTLMDHALEVRKRWNVLTLAISTAEAQFKRRFASEYTWVSTMREDIRRNNVAFNSPLAVKVNQVHDKLEKLLQEALEPLKKSKEELKPEYDKAQQFLKDNNDKYFQERR